jgi:hypothetical protein
MEEMLMAVTAGSNLLTAVLMLARMPSSRRPSGAKALSAASWLKALQRERGEVISRKRNNEKDETRHSEGKGGSRGTPKEKQGRIEETTSVAGRTKEIRTGLTCKPGG